MSTTPLPLRAIIVRGAGEMATGIAWRLHRSGFKRVLMTELDNPIAVRRTVSFCEALHNGSQTVEGVTAQRIERATDAPQCWESDTIPVLPDPDNRARDIVRPDVVVDAVMAKTNLGTSITDAELVIGLGPGFTAGADVHCVVETNRGHYMGSLIFDGCAQPDTGVPGDVGGQSALRVLRAPTAGCFVSDYEIGTMVGQGEIVGAVNDQPVKALIDGALRGLIKSGTIVGEGLKIGDVDPRGDPAYCETVSEKARAIGGGVLEAVLMRFNR